MSDYTKATNFTSKDSLSTGNPLKIVKGTEIDTEFNNIQTAIATKADLASPTFSGSVTIVGGTITGITDLAVADGGTGASDATTARSNLSAAKSGANSDITSITGLTTPLPVAQGGIGVATLTANNVLLGNGTSALQVVAPGTSGNVLTSNGTTWTSGSAGVTSVNGQTGAVVLTDVNNIGSIGVLMTASGSNTAYGGTTAGSNLRYNSTMGSNNSAGTTPFNSYSNVFTGYGLGGTAPSGTWRKLNSGTAINTDPPCPCYGRQYTQYCFALYIRVS